LHIHTLCLPGILNTVQLGDSYLIIMRGGIRFKIDLSAMRRKCGQGMGAHEGGRRAKEILDVIRNRRSVSSFHCFAQVFTPISEKSHTFL